MKERQVQGRGRMRGEHVQLISLDFGSDYKMCYIFRQVRQYAVGKTKLHIIPRHEILSSAEEITEDATQASWEEPADESRT